MQSEARLGSKGEKRLGIADLREDFRSVKMRVASQQGCSALGSERLEQFSRGSQNGKWKNAGPSPSSVSSGRWADEKAEISQRRESGKTHGLMGSCPQQQKRAGLNLGPCQFIPTNRTGER